MPLGNYRSKLSVLKKSMITYVEKCYRIPKKRSITNKGIKAIWDTRSVVFLCSICEQSETEI